MDLNIRATTDYKVAFKDSEYGIVCTPTDFNEEVNCYDTSSVEDVISKVRDMNVGCDIIIKSTIPLGYTEKMREIYNYNNIYFSPEFLREGKALYDNLYPSRIVVGDKGEHGVRIAELLKSCSLKEDIPIKLMESKEAESVKLFSNNYLALRVSYFNELDSFAENNGLNSKDIIEAVCLDPRIGNYYNNPSFGFGGYCLPKDTKQLLSSFKYPPKALIENTVKSNEERKDHITRRIISFKPNMVGIYRINMKKESDNYRESAVLDIIEGLKKENVEVVIYEPSYDKDTFKDIRVIKDFDLFLEETDLIVANRIDEKLKKTNKLIYSRDIFNRD